MKIREKLKLLMGENSQVYSRVFDMNYRSSINKDVIYSHFHRNETFTSDREWIKNNLAMESPLTQVDI